MLILERVTSPRVALWLVQGLSLFRAPSPNLQLESWVGQDWGTGVRTLFIPSDDTTPAAFCAFKDGVSLILVDGVTTLTQATGFVNGYGRRPDIRVSGVDNLFVNEVYARLAGRMATGLFLPQGQIFWAGYSMGGDVVQKFATVFPNLTNATITQTVFTFGTPRFAGENECRQLVNAARVMRWFLAEDPVPLIMPRLSEMPSQVLLLTPAQIAFNGRFLHPQEGIQINADGSLADKTVPSAAAISVSTSLLAWFWAIVQDEESFHSLIAYFRRLQGIVLANPPAPPLPDRTRERPEVPTSQEIDRVETQQATTVRTIERTQNAAVVSVPNFRFVHAVRRGKLYYLVFGGVDIACPGTRRRARGLARQLNNFLINLQTVAVVDPEALLQTLQEYLRAATNPSSDFRPTMNTRV